MNFYSCVFIVTILYLRAVVRAKTVSLSVQINDDDHHHHQQVVK